MMTGFLYRLATEFSFSMIGFEASDYERPVSTAGGESSRPYEARRGRTCQNLPVTAEKFSLVAPV